MKKILFAFFLLFGISTSFSQPIRNVSVFPLLDTAQVQFKELHSFWRTYMNELNVINMKSAGLLNQMPNELRAYWSDDENKEYLFPDLYYAFFRSKGNVWYTNDNEFLLGIVKKDTNTFELKTMFKTDDDGFFRGFPSAIFAVRIKRIDSKYVLENVFSYHKSHLKKKEFSDITYYYSDEYTFNDQSALQLNKRIEEFKKGFGLTFDKSILYLTANSLVEISKWFGIDYTYFDFGSISDQIKGGYISVNNMILSGGGGENYLHEIIHLMLSEIDHGRYMQFEEGLATYFGEHVDKKYPDHIPAFKQFLNRNGWINLSGSLYGYFETGIPGSNVDTLHSNTENNPQLPFRDIAGGYNFQYMVHAVICDLAFRKGGYEKVKELLCLPAGNESEFYKNVTQVLGIPKADMNKTLRDFINLHY